MDKELDREFLKSYYNDMVDEIGEIFELVLEEMPKDIELLDAAVACNNHTEVAQIIHKIAPCFYNIGLPQLTTLAKNIELNINANNTDTVASDVDFFKAEYDSYLPAIKAECERLNNI
jgi:HPt (histidine-containing phosphotransfer) domain-containing protein